MAREIIIRQRPAKEIAAWAAGFFDGEGTVVIGKHTKNGSYSLRASVCNTKVEALNDLIPHYGGRICRNNGNGTPEHPIWKNCYSWYVDRWAAKEFLLSVLPYLRIKLQQAITGLEFYAYSRSNSRYCSRKPMGGRGLTPQARAMDRKLYQRIKDLNARGKSAIQNS